jgi:hypothetical protein
MRIVVINGEPDAASTFDAYVHSFTARLAQRDNAVREFTLRDMELHGCTGCFGCWVRTPGECMRSVERLIPLLHPYIEIEGGEMHHRKRYERYPDIALIVARGSDTDSEDLEITRNLWDRLARNFKSRMRLFAVADQSSQEVADELVAAA